MHVAVDIMHGPTRDSYRVIELVVDPMDVLEHEIEVLFWLKVVNEDCPSGADEDEPQIMKQL